MKSKAEAETVSRKLRELTDDELSQVSGGTDSSYDHVNWPCFGAAVIIRGGGAIPALKELVAAIRKKDWCKVSEIAKRSAVASIPIIVEALNEARTE